MRGMPPMYDDIVLPTQSSTQSAEYICRSAFWGSSTLSPGRGTGLELANSPPAAWGSIGETRPVFIFYRRTKCRNWSVACFSPRTGFDTLPHRARAVIAVDIEREKAGFFFAGVYLRQRSPTPTGNESPNRQYGLLRL